MRSPKSVTGNRLLTALPGCIFFFFLFVAVSAADSSSGIVVFSEPGFPAADSSSPSLGQLKSLLPDGSFVSAEQLPPQLNNATARLLVLPYGSAFPEDTWPDIYAFLQRGGNLLVLGGQPFTRAAYRDAPGWRLRDYNVRFTQELMIDQYQVAPGSEGLTFETNPDVVTQLPRFSWKRTFSPIIRLSAVDLYPRGGSAGSLDARLDALAWGTRDGRRITAPAIQIDHLRNRFTGGRWIFLNADVAADFYDSAAAKQITSALAQAALRGSEQFIVRPMLPLYLADEPVELDVKWEAATKETAAFTARISVAPEQQPSRGSTITVSVPLREPAVLRVPGARGFQIIKAELLEGNKVRAVYRSGFWIRDEAYLRSGPKMTVNKDYFELDGHPLAVVGTTYMSSEVQRLFFDHPNVYVWDRDLGQISGAGLNMIRTGWWTGWDKLCDETGRPYERTLRTLEAYLMTARKHGLPVQFNFFAFLPEVLGGANPYLDPDAVRKQRALIFSVVERFRDVPYLAWDLINEPSISKYLWRTRPNEDPVEFERWNQWLSQRYPDRKALAHAWNLPRVAAEGPLPAPTDFEFTPRAMYVGQNSLKVYDYYLFAQESFAGWAREMRDAIRATGSTQLVTVGQDEGGFRDRLSPAFFGPAVDFTTSHSWWENDSLLWDSLVAKQPGLPMLIQETGLQRELTLDEIARRTPENEAALFERKFAMSFVQGSGAIEWLWNTNGYMTEANEAPIGGLRVDATEKPEAAVLRDFARFARAMQDELRNPQQPVVAIVTSQAAQFSVALDVQVEAQRKAVRALVYHTRVPGYVIAENQIAKLGSPKLVILPSSQALNGTTWQSLLNYVKQGGNFLVTGPVERDEHWQVARRAIELDPGAQLEPLTYRTAEIRLKDQAIPLSFDQQKQSWLEALRFKDGSTFKEFSFGAGRIFWAAYPVELAEGLDAAANVYSYVLGQLGLAPSFELATKLSTGVLVYPTVLQDSVLYVMFSDRAEDADIDLRDKLTGGRVTLRLPAQRAALAVVRRSDGTIKAKYGF